VRSRPSAALAAALAGLLVVACTRGGAPLEEIALQGDALGTTYTVKVVDDQTPALATRRLDLDAAVRGALELVDTLMSTYQADSEVSTFNRADAGVPVPISPPTVEVVSLALQVSRQSGGAFDITVGPLVDAWGFGPRRHHDPPAPELVRAIEEHVGFHLLSLDPAAGTLTKSVDGVEIDLSAIAKGYAVDRVAAALEDAGADRYMVEVGGEIRARGSNRQGEPWRLAVERPTTTASRTVQRILPLSDGALATSGDYRNFYEIDGRRYSHTLDPRTGAPVTHSLASVSVLAPDCAAADAWATAFMVLGPEAGHTLAEARNIAALFLVYNAEGGVDEHPTSALDRFLAAPTGTIPPDPRTAE